jgi:hypothetical protein
LLWDYEALWIDLKMARNFVSNNIDISSGLGLGTKPITLVAWAANSSLTNSGIFSVGQNSGGVNNRVFVELDNIASSNLFSITQYISGTSSFVRGATNNPFNGTWTHFAGVLVASGSSLVYVNGVQDGSNAISTSSITGMNHATIGAVVDASGSPVNFFSGRIADVAAYNVALTATEIAALAKGARPYQIRPSGLVGYWPLDGLQSPEPDLSGNKNNGALTGTAAAFGPPLAPFTRTRPQFWYPPATISVSYQRTQQILMTGP